MLYLINFGADIEQDNGRELNIYKLDATKFHSKKFNLIELQPDGRSGSKKKFNISYSIKLSILRHGQSYPGSV